MLVEDVFTFLCFQLRVSVSAIFVGNSDLLEEGEEQEGCQGIHSGEEDKGERWH